MSDEKPSELDLANAEIVGLKITISRLESDLAARDRTIESLERRRTPLSERSKTDPSAFNRPFTG